LKQLGGEPVAVAELARSIAEGKLDNAITIKQGDSDSLMLTMKTMQDNLQAIINTDVGRVLEALSRGDLTEKITNDYPGVFGQLKDDANTTVEKLKEIILNEVGRVLEALSRGDLTEKISNAYPGAFGQLKDNSNSTVEKLMEIIAQVKYSTDMITTAAQEIAAGNGDLSQRTEEQASSLEEISSSMSELLSTVRRNTESARHAGQTRSISPSPSISMALIWSPVPALPFGKSFSAHRSLASFGAFVAGSP
jgi:methyl-accepting chemotaxis protein